MGLSLQKRLALRHLGPLGAFLGGAGRPIGLTKWKAAVTRVKAGTGRGRVVIISDSTGMGAGAGTSGTSNLIGAFTNDWPKQLAADLATAGIPTSFNSFFCDQNIRSALGATAYPTYDTRIATFETGWQTTIAGLGGNLFAYTAGTASKLSFTPPGAIDTAITYYIRNTGTGSFSVNVDGGAPLGTIVTNGAAALLPQSYSFAKGNHTVQLVANNDASFFLSGVIAYDSTTPAIDIIQTCSYAAKAADFNVATSPWSPFPAIATLAADLYIICLTINDSNTPTNLAAYTSQIQALITQCKLSGDVLLMVGIPSNTAQATNGTLDTFIAALQGLCVTNTCSLVNMKAIWGSYLNIQPTFTYFDNLHSLQPGYQGPPANGYNDVATSVGIPLIRAAA